MPHRAPRANRRTVLRPGKSSVFQICIRLATEKLRIEHGPRTPIPALREARAASVASRQSCSTTGMQWPIKSGSPVASCVDCDPGDLKFEALEPEPRDTDDGERRMVIPR
jgi:hypothetical protein